MSKDRAWVEINLSAIEENYKELCNICKMPPIAVVKANGYGHGAVEAALACERAGAEILAVACIDEAIELYNAGVKESILIFGPTARERMPELAKYNFVQTVASLAYAKELHEVAPNVKVHIKVDTGMGRLGIKTPAEGREIAKLLDAEGIFTHLADADNPDLRYTMRQVERFDDFLEALKADFGIMFKYYHVANSSAILNFKEVLKYKLTRPGILIYGVYPDGRAELNLRPAMSLYSRVCDVREVKCGENISYGRTYTAEKDMQVAVLPIGYADGLNRALSNCGEAYISGKRYPIVGRICMDLCMVDVTDSDVKVGDTAELFGEHISVNELSDKLNTIPYEIISGVGRRIHREYVTK